MPTKVLADANIYYSRTLRDWLLIAQITSANAVFRTYWTEDIIAEALYRLRRNHPTWPGRSVTLLRDRIAAALEGGRVDDFVVDGSFPGTDPDDAHVHAAAVSCGAQIVLTDDHGFRKAFTEDAPYDVLDADAFFVLLDDTSPETVRQVAERQARHFWQTRGEADLCRPLKAAGCPRFAERVRMHLQVLDTGGW